MTQKKKNPSYRKISNEVKKAGGLKRATYAQVEHIYKLLMLKYVMSLEDQLKEDKAHLLLKQETIEELILDTRHKTNQIRRKNIAINRVSKINKYFNLQLKSQILFTEKIKSSKGNTKDKAIQDKDNPLFMNAMNKFKGEILR